MWRLDGDNMIIGVDFDGTLCHAKWPDVGEPNRKLIDKLLRLQRRGNKIIFGLVGRGMHYLMRLNGVKNSIWYLMQLMTTCQK